MPDNKLESSKINYEGYVNLLFEIFGLNGLDHHLNRQISTKFPKAKRHWWYGLKRKPHIINIIEN